MRFRAFFAKIIVDIIFTRERFRGKELLQFELQGEWIYEYSSFFNLLFNCMVHDLWNGNRITEGYCGSSGTYLWTSVYKAPDLGSDDPVHGF